MNKEIWKIIFPESKETEDYYSLFYSGIKLSILRNNHYFIPQGIAINFTSYFNALPIKKWKLYTCVKNFYLKIFVKGDFQLNIIGYSFNSATLKKTIIYSNNYINSNSFFNIELQDMMDVELIGFEIISHSNCEFIDASYYADFDESNIKPIVLGLVTVTYKKEEYILRNIKNIKDELLGEISDIRENFYIHVIDNGKTLKHEDIEGYHIQLHPNNNIGGAGGFTYGIIKSLEQTPKATHVLLMDDDVYVIPEVIRRTYVILSELKNEWKLSCISGAMLKLNKMNIFHEDLGRCTNDSDQYNSLVTSLKFPNSDLHKINKIILLNKELYNNKYIYSGWWYCCIPSSLIDTYGLPLPFFSQIDDIEYSLRIKPKYITMSGISIWHESFEIKRNSIYAYYFAIRNMLITQALHNTSLKKIIFFAKRNFFKFLLSYSYGEAELILHAIEDYLKGSIFIESNINDFLLRKYSLLKENFKPIPEYKINTDLKSIIRDDIVKVSFIKKFIFLSTFNFHFLIPGFLLNKKTSIVNLNGPFNYKSLYKRRNVLVINDNDYTAVLRSQDRKKCKKLLFSYLKVFFKFKFKHKKINKEYIEKFKLFKTKDFWINKINAN